MLAVENEVKVAPGSVNVAVELSRVVAAKQIEFNDKAEELARREEAAKQAAKDAREDVVSLSDQGLQAKDSGANPPDNQTASAGNGSSSNAGASAPARVDIQV